MYLYKKYKNETTESVLYKALFQAKQQSAASGIFLKQAPV
jgi:hypothetical protein